MNFELNDEQSALADSLARLLSDRYDFAKRSALVASGKNHDCEVWKQFAELGLTALPLPQAHGGFGGGARDLAPVMQQLGRALSIEPFLASAVLGSTAIGAVASDEVQARLLPGVCTGATVLAWAHDEPSGRHAPLWIETRANQTNSGWAINGSKSQVLCAGIANYFVVSARTDGANHDPDGCALFLVDRHTPGLRLREFALLDDSNCGELHFSDVRAMPLSDVRESSHVHLAIDRTLAAGISAACADMVGASQASFELTMDYLRTRKQFGRFLGENQALRHRAAEMLVHLEMARSMAIAASVAADHLSAEGSRSDLSRAKLSVARNARMVAHGAVQLHGGIGMTEELAVGHYLRRIHVLDQIFGDSDSHAAKLAAFYE